MFKSLYCLMFIAISIALLNKTSIAQNQNKYFDNLIILKLKTDFSGNHRDINLIRQELAKVFFNNSSFEIKREFPNTKKPESRFNKNGIPNVDITNIYRISYSGDESVNSLVKKLNRLEDIEYAEPLYIHNEMYIPNDPLNETSQYWLANVKAFQAWDIHKGGADVVIGVSDTGFDINHPDLYGNIKFNENDPIDGIDNDGDGFIDNYSGWNFGEDNNDVQSVNSAHGTYVSGISSAVCDNNIGVSGAAYNCKFLPIKAYNESKKMMENVFQTIVYAADQGCKIVNCSWGGNNYQQMGQDVINYASINKDMLVVAAAGNTKTDLNFYPASYRYVLSVAGTNELDEKHSVSTFSHRVDVSAPCNSFYSTDNNANYTQLWAGTSYAAPIVAGLAGILRSYFPNYNALQIKELIKRSADNIYHLPNNLPYLNKLGSGRVNFYRALTMQITPSIVFDMNKASQEDDKLSINGLFTNYLANAQNLSIKIESLSEYVSIDNPLIFSGNLNTLETFSPENDIIFTLTHDIPLDFILNLKLSYSSDNYSDYQFIDIPINKGYLNVFTDLLELSIASNGRFGYDDKDCRIGDGFTMGTKSDLFNDCGIISGCSLSNLFSSVRQDSDFKTLVPPFLLDSEFADTHVKTIFDDSKDDASIGITYTQDVYSWNDDENKNFILVDYTLRNTSSNIIEDFYFGIFTDWDLDDPVNNSCHYITKESFLYAKTNNIDSLYSGIKILSNLPVINYSYLNQTGGDGHINLKDVFSDEEKYYMITNSKVVNPNTSSDVCIYSGLGPFSIPANDSINLSLAFIASRDYQGLEKALEKSREKYNILHPPNKIKLKYNIEEVSIFPNPTSNYLMILSSLPCYPSVDVFIYDEMGNVVYKELDFDGEKINLKHLRQGIYIITVGCEGVLDRKKIIKLD